MPVTRGIKLTGLDELEQMLKDVLPADAKKALQGTTNKLADKMRDRLRAAAPKDSGLLEKQIKARAIKSKKPNHPAAGVFIGDDAFYWRFLEYGTVNMPAKPFIARTVEQNRSSVVSTFEHDLQAQLAASARKRKKI